MNNPHPYRYAEALRGQPARLERLYPGILTTKSWPTSDKAFLEIEQSGTTSFELARRSQRLRHLESLIADWHIDGEELYTVRVGDEIAIGDGMVSFPDIPAAVCYVELDLDMRLALRSRPKSYIEGVYLREIAALGRFSAELTFVCAEPGWRTGEHCAYSDALEVASRIAVGVVPLGETFSPHMDFRRFDGDPLLTREPAIGHAIVAASAFAALGLWKPPVVRSSRVHR